MAKTKNLKFQGELNCVVTPKSKNTTYVQTNTTTPYQYSYNVDLSAYPDYYHKNFAFKSGSNLIIKTIFYDHNYSLKKTVTTTVKDYFADSYLSSFGPIKICTVDNCEIAQNTQPGKGGLFADAAETSGQDFILASSAKNAELSLTKGGRDFVYDAKGNDTYNLTHVYSDEGNYFGWDTVYEFAGNDKYQTGVGTYADIYDYKGNDTYEAIGTYTKLSVADLVGNDRYTTEDNGFIYSTDYKGSDKYFFYSNTGSDIDDFAGNDNYVFENAKIESTNDNYYVKDWKGSDNYNVSSCAGVMIEDNRGKDSYTVNNCLGLSTAAHKTDLYISDRGKSNDTYTFNTVEFAYFDAEYPNVADDGGKDRYTLTAVKNFAITDDGGADKYNVRQGTNGIKITDRSGADKYSFIGAADNFIKDIYVEDYSSQNDSYSFKYVNNEIAWIGDYTNYRTVKDDAGNDKYSIADSKAVLIDDNSGNDKYTVKAQNLNTEQIVICDNSGNDKYTINGTYNKKTKETKQVTYFGVTDSGTGNDIYNIENAKLVVIKDYGGKNKINAKKSLSIQISVEGDYTDKYSFSNCTGYNVTDFGTTKRDIYNIKSSSGSIYDRGGDDIYKIDKLKLTENSGIYIADHGGNDKITISNLKKSDIVFMSNYDKTENNYNNKSNELIIYDKKNNGYLRLSNFYSADENNEGQYDGYGNGKIEKIIAGKTALKNIPTTDYFTSTLRQEVGAWLETTEFDDVIDVLNGGTSDQIQELIGYFNQYHG